MRGLIWAALALGVVGPPSPAIYRCTGAAGEAMFSDLPCPGGSVEALRPLTTLHMAGLSADERATLDRLDRERLAQSRIDQRRSIRPSAAQSRALDQSARRCAAAQAGLDRVRAMKRRGYRASGAAALDARERDYAARRDRDCADRR